MGGTVKCIVRSGHRCDPGIFPLGSKSNPVLTKFASVIWYSFALSLASFVLEIIIAIPAGIAAARKQYSATDYTITVIALVGISLPSFFVATLLKWVFSVKLGWFDLYGIVGRNFQSLSSGLFSGAMVTETLFQIPGIGYTSYQAVLQGDIPFVMFYMLFSAVLILLGNLIADILYAVVDPRVRVN